MLEVEPGTWLPESGAILLYLAEGTDLLPADPLERAHVHRWLFFEQAAVVTDAELGLVVLRAVADGSPSGSSAPR